MTFIVSADKEHAINSRIVKELWVRDKEIDALLENEEVAALEKYDSEELADFAFNELISGRCSYGHGRFIQVMSNEAARNFLDRIRQAQKEEMPELPAGQEADT